MTVTVLAATVQVPARAQTAEDVVNKMIEVSGGRKALAKIKDTTYIGTVDIAQYGVSGSFTMYQKEPNKLRMDIEVEGMLITQAFDGQKGWYTDPQSQSTVEMPEAVSKDFARQAQGNDYLLNPEKHGITYSLKPKETVDGIDCIVLEQKNDDGHISVIYLNSSTYLPYKTMTKTLNLFGAQAEVETFPSDYKKVGDIVIAHSLRTLQDGVEAMRLTFSEVNFNTGLEDAIFQMK